MELSDDLLTVYSGKVEQRDGSHVVEVPEREIEYGSLEDGEVYRIVVLPQKASSNADRDESTDAAGVGEETGFSGPPVEAGEQRTVEIESMGDQGDGIARVERGYVVIVPETEVDERVTVEIADVRENVAFADVVKRHPYYE